MTDVFVFCHFGTATHLTWVYLPSIYEPSHKIIPPDQANAITLQSQRSNNDMRKGRLTIHKG